MKRRRMSGKMLAELSGLSPVTVSRLAKAHNPPDLESVTKFSKALNYPVEFFFGDQIDMISEKEVSFRSLSRLTARDRDAAIAAGSLGVQLANWVGKNFNLPSNEVPNLRDIAPRYAARVLRQEWALGEKPIPNMIKLLESKGVRVLSLAEDTKQVDAFSFWHSDTPFVFLNNLKSAERSRFDAAHELGHLVMHQHSKLSDSKEVEREADYFASEFLMPEQDVLANRRRNYTADTLIKQKSRWRVSAMALAYRLHYLDILSDWQYRSICIDLSRRGYRASEPKGIKKETSIVWKKVFEQLWREKTTREDIAKDLQLPLYEVENLVSGILQIPDRLEKSHNVALEIMGNDAEKNSSHRN